MEPILECRTPPASPELSRLVTKRRCPFGESPQQSKFPATEAVMAHTVDQSSNDCAFQLLMNSQRNQSRDPGPSQTDQSAVISSSLCWVCHQQGEAMPCAFCEHSVCEMCVRQCDRCFGVFCAFCSTIKYDNHEDRPLCLTCHNEELRLQKLRVANVGVSQQSGVQRQGKVERYRLLTA